VIKSLELVEHLTKLYEQEAALWLLAHGWPQEVQWNHPSFSPPPQPPPPLSNPYPCTPQVVDGLDIRADLGVSTLLINEDSSRAGQHRDPAGPMPSLVAGTSGFRWGPLGWVPCHGGEGGG
jgi:hypothetical protein